ncbi:MAG: hypothetical protein GTO24_12945 [candidate division Zixibacteria bacterium]|nr:hypothetical protein [candidate division Zixibacteria bacterium]
MSLGILKSLLRAVLIRAKKRRMCGECHATKTVKKLKKGKLKLTWFEKCQQRSSEGVISVVHGKLGLVFTERKDGGWLPVKNALPPVVRHSAYGTPILEEQLKKLAQEMGK